MDIQNLKDYIESILGDTTKVFIIGHNQPDLDSLGSAIGMYELMRHLGKEAYIIVDDDKKTLEAGTKKLLVDTALRKKNAGDKIPFIKKNKYLKEVDKSSLVIIVDNNNIDKISIKDVLNLCGHTIIIDHHKINNKTYQSNYNLIDKESSSASELVELLLTEFNFEYDSDVATALLAGLHLDTDRFQAEVRKTDRTNEVWFRLVHDKNKKADRFYVEKLFEQEFEKERIINLLIYMADENKSNTKFVSYTIFDDNAKPVGLIRSSYTRNKFYPETLYEKEVLAAAADKVLRSFPAGITVAMGFMKDNELQISLRTNIPTISAGSIMERVGGGGDDEKAAAQIKISGVNKAGKMELLEKRIRHIIKKEILEKYLIATEVVSLGPETKNSKVYKR